MHNLVLADTARRVYEKAQPDLQRKLDRCFDLLRTEPRRHPNIRSLKGRWDGYYRFRVGDHRVVYRIDDHSRVVIVVVIAHRSEVYG
jgi:mRNA interferase RelE/StbE